ncbi:MAG: helix-turn-helix domain-containing protein [Clostridia bacterium]|nr:helix-turn-helix domain-containing protein [Clostridia bacterium]
MNYGEALRYAREEKGLSQLELAEKTGISHQNINRWESGKVLPNIDFCVKLANFYGITLDELVGRTTE